MKTRHVGIVVCGAVAGIITGSAILSSMQGISVSANLSPLYHSLMFAQVLPRGEVLRRQESVSAQPAASAASSSLSSSSSSVAEEPEEIPAICSAIAGMAQELVDTVDLHLIDTARNAAVRRDLIGLADAYVALYCLPVPAQAPVSSPLSSAGSVDNHCEQYGMQTARYVTCLSEQQGGRVYPNE
ncbi:MAG: hypothetical protein PHW10_03960 [Candidatus Peribacteraceae bacterium]|nr:hypothetical protein [Candidatus Peribacteraceae bacterium]